MPYTGIWVIRGEDPGVSTHSDRATFDCAGEIPAVCPLEDVLEAEVSFADVIEEDGLLPNVAVPPDDAFTSKERLESAGESLVGKTSLAGPRGTPEVPDAARALPTVVSRVEKAS